MSNFTTLIDFSANQIQHLSQVEGVYVKSNLKDGLLKIDNPNKLCPLCPSKLNMDVKYTVSAHCTSIR